MFRFLLTWLVVGCFIFLVELAGAVIYTFGATESVKCVLTQLWLLVLAGTVAKLLLAIREMYLIDIRHYKKMLNIDKEESRTLREQLSAAESQLIRAQWRISELELYTDSKVESVKEGTPAEQET